MTDDKRVWLDPRDCGLGTVETERKRKEEAERKRKEEVEQVRGQEIERQRRKEAERKRREEQAMKREEEKKNAARTQGLPTQPKPEILPPASKVAALASPDGVAVPGLDLAEFERQIRNSAKMLNLAEPEGFLDRVFGRADHRIKVKIDRGRLLAGYIAACTASIQAAGSVQDARGQIYLNQLILLRRVAEENHKLELTRRQIERQDAIEEAKAREIIADHEAKIREHGLRGRPAPPPLPPPPPHQHQLRLMRPLAKRTRRAATVWPNRSFISTNLPKQQRTNRKSSPARGVKRSLFTRILTN